MGELWRDLVELLRRRPLLWGPVLVADLLGYLINLGRSGLIQLVIFQQTAQHSALGGSVVHGPMSAGAVQSTTIIALLLSWFSYFLRILLYSTALLATASLIQSFHERVSQPVAAVPSALAARWGGILELALRALAVYAVASLLFGWLSPVLAKHGHRALLHNAWFGYSLTLLLLLTLSAMLPPVVLRVLSGKQPSRSLATTAQQFSFILALVASGLAAFVNANSRQLAQAPTGARYPLELIGSLVAALPYVLLFTGLSLLSRRQAGSRDEPTTV